jgi:hypothetical protein
MTLPALVRDLILGGSFAAVGLLVYMGAMRLRSYVRYRRPIDAVFARFDLSVAVIVGLIAEAVFHLTAPPITARLVVYTVSLYVLAQAVYANARQFHRRDRRSTDGRRPDGSTGEGSQDEGEEAAG